MLAVWLFTIANYGAVILVLAVLEAVNIISSLTMAAGMVAASSIGLPQIVMLFIHNPDTSPRMGEISRVEIEMHPMTIVQGFGAMAEHAMKKHPEWKDVKEAADQFVKAWSGKDRYAVKMSFDPQTLNVGMCIPLIG